MENNLTYTPDVKRDELNNKIAQLEDDFKKSFTESKIV